MGNAPELALLIGLCSALFEVRDGMHSFRGLCVRSPTVSTQLEMSPRERQRLVFPPWRSS